MPGTFIYNEATNTVEVTAGTEGAPATFNDMYTADQAGAGTELLVAEAGAANNTLTYLIRPTHDKALIVKCIVAAKTTEADYIFITGTDAWDLAQTESIDVSAGNGSYSSTKRFGTITNLDCSDNVSGGGTVWADGTIAVTQDIWGVVWEFAIDANYKIDTNVDFGDGSTSTYFTSLNEMVYFEDGVKPSVVNQATLRLGELNGGEWGINGSAWRIFATTSINFGGNYLMYDSSVLLMSGQTLAISISGIEVVDIRNSIFTGVDGTLALNNGNSMSLKRINFSGLGAVLWLSPPDTSEDLLFNDMFQAIQGQVGTPVIKDSVLDNNTRDLRAVGSANTFVIDSIVPSSLTVAVDSSGSVNLQYTTNIKTVDNDGADLSAVTVECQSYGNIVSPDGGTTFYRCIEDHTAGTFATDLAANKWVLESDADVIEASGCLGTAQDGAWVTGIDYIAAASQFSVATGDNGDIAEQTLAYKKWVGASEALLTFSPHTFTYTHAAYPTIETPLIPVDSPIRWRTEIGGGAVIIVEED